MKKNQPDPRPGSPSKSHVELGRELGIYASDPRVGPGLPLWLPHGSIIRSELQKLGQEEALARGCQQVYTPVLAKRELFETSGHWAKFADDMFPAMSEGGEELILRPSNCPHHALVFGAQPHSYRDLPVRYHELAPMFRAERSGVVAGLRRVRQISLDDVHVFCAPEQIGDEVQLALESVLRCYAMLGLAIHRVHLSVRDRGDGYLGSDEQWARSEAQLAAGLQRAGLPYELNPGGAVFYGPKIDIEVMGAGGRCETLSTVQLDFNQPQRFDLKYTGPDGQDQRPVMIHCGVMSSMERMVALLLEVHQGRMPPWLAPVQVALIAVNADQDAAVQAIARDLGARCVRVQILDQGSVSARIRQARELRTPWIGVVGPAEAKSGEVALTAPALGNRSSLPVAGMVAQVSDCLLARRALPELGG